MYAHRITPLLSIATLLSLAACAPDDDSATTGSAAEELAAADAAPASALADANMGGLAERVVVQSARIKQGEKVMISGGARDLALLEELAVQVRRVGAFPLLILSSEGLDRRLVVDVPEQYDTQLPELDLALVQVFDVGISVDYGETPGLNADVPPERMMRRAEAARPVMEAATRRGARTVNLGNDMYPTVANSERLGVGREQLQPMFLAGVGADPAVIQARGDSLKQLLASASELRITHPNGTDLRVNIAGRPIQVSDGAISPEDEAAGVAGRSVWLPAGEVYFTPVGGSATGRVVAERIRYMGDWVEGLTMDFAQGRLTSITARTGGDRLLAAYNAAGQGKDQFALIDFGINPAVTLPATSPGTWVADGFVSVGIGNDTWAGGTNQAAFGQFVHLGGATVTAGDRTIIDAGRLVLQ